MATIYALNAKEQALKLTSFEHYSLSVTITTNSLDRKFFQNA
jgi:hypothetical protein